jgi:hypothetical protein
LLVLAFLLPPLGVSLNVSGDIHSWMRGATIALVLWALVISRFEPAPGARPARAWIATVLQAVVVLLLAAAHVKAGVPAARYFERTRRAAFVDAASHSVLSAAARRDGLLLTASDLHRIQILTRRPVLLDGGAIDALAYVPESGPALERIAVDVYGISLLSPPFGADQPTGGFPPDTGRQLWETRTVEAWQDIREKYGVTDVLTYGDWRLALPAVSTRPDMILWSIPPRAALPR